jgi:hypothetical protein
LVYVGCRQTRGLRHRAIRCRPDWGSGRFLVRRVRRQFTNEPNVDENVFLSQAQENVAVVADSEVVPGLDKAETNPTGDRESGEAEISAVSRARAGGGPATWAKNPARKETGFFKISTQMVAISYHAGRASREHENSNRPSGCAWHRRRQMALMQIRRYSGNNTDDERALGVTFFPRELVRTVPVASSATAAHAASPPHEAASPTGGNDPCHFEFFGKRRTSAAGLR